VDKDIPAVLAMFPGVRTREGGAGQSQQEVPADMLKGAAFALFLIYALMAIPLRSYAQPLIIMSVIPFGAIGALVGHWILQIEVSMLSFFGIIALSGVVVNASLVLVDYINRQRRSGVDLLEAVAAAGVVRFRPIILTSVTTFIGLLPMLSRGGDPTTAFIIPMAISLAFGVLFATVITLLLVPCLYLMVEDYIPWGELEREASLARQDAAHEAAQAQPAMGGGR
jgi:multidrug efflux pump subunit AcrB